MARKSRSSFLFGVSRVLPLVLLGTVLGSPGLHAEFAYLPSQKDTTLPESLTGTLANGSGPAIFAGRINTNTESRRRALIAFDVAGAIPAGSIITQATLTLNLTSTSAGPVPVALHRVLADWGEGNSFASGGGGAPAGPGDSTWLHRFYDEVFWSSPGGDFDPAARASAIVDQPGPYSWDSTPGMVGDVQSWLDEPSENFGWFLIADETRPQTVKRFDSRENPAEAGRPLLYVEFAPPCAPNPLGPGYWRLQCASLSGDGIGGHPGWTPPGATEAGFAEWVLPCAGKVFGDLGLPGEDACAALVVDPTRTCRERTLRRLSVLVLNVCAGRLQTSCPVAPTAGPCLAANIGDLIQELAGLVVEGECRSAPDCDGGPNQLP